MPVGAIVVPLNGSPVELSQVLMPAETPRGTFAVSVSRADSDEVYLVDGGPLYAVLDGMCFSGGMFARKAVLNFTGYGRGSIEFVR